MDDLVENAGVGIAPLHVAHGDKREIGLGLRQGRRPEPLHFRGLASSSDRVEIRGVGEEPLQQDLVHGAARGGQSAGADGGAEGVIRSPFQVAGSQFPRFPADADGGRLGILEEGPDDEALAPCGGAKKEQEAGKQELAHAVKVARGHPGVTFCREREYNLAI